jgi:hypothetical protein
MKRVLFIAAVAVALAAPSKSEAGCRLFSKLFGGRCGSSSQVVTGCSSGQCGQSVVVQTPVSAPVQVERPAFIPATCPDGKCGNPGVLQTGPSRFRLFR